MKKTIITLSIALTSAGVSYSQSALGAYGVSQPDLKGTARYMGMAGAFGALGGDLTSISSNPAGIGVYRSSDIGFSLDLDIQNSSTEADGRKYDMDQTKFLLNNIGAVLTLRLASNTLPNLNFGFTYNKGPNFNRIYGGNVGLKSSMSNFFADVANYYGVTVNDVTDFDGQDPYNVDYGYFQAPWQTILAANSGVIVPEYDPVNKTTNWYGLWENSMTGKSTSGVGNYVMQEKGGVDEFNIVIGGNIANKLYWGMNFQILNMNYQLNAYWGESLNNAYNLDQQGNYIVENANWNFNNISSLSGTGFSYQLGFIYKPVQALRLGFAFHTPTWYGLNEEFYGSMNYNGEYGSYSSVTNGGIPGYNSYNLRTPWKILASAAGVIGNSFILSFDYEWANYGKMHFSEPTYYYNDWYDPYPWPYAYGAAPATRANGYDYLDPYGDINSDIATYYKSTNTFRVGLEFKPISALSIRAGYSYVSSPVTKTVKDNSVAVFTSPLSPSYRLDNTTNYITFGLGYRYQHVYVDLAYVYKHMGAEYHAYTPWTPGYVGNQEVYFSTDAPQSKVSLTNNQIVLSVGYRF